MYTLLIRLAGPLQSWGTGSYYDDRQTDYYPSKSGVIGLIAAAMGRKRDEDISDLCKLRFGIRIDNQGKIVSDFQITDMASDRLIEFFTGKTKKYNANLSHRDYLSDAIFLAGFESDDKSFLETIESSLLNPVYTVFLGRRSCPPTEPLVIGIREKRLYDALYDEDWQMPEWRQDRVLSNGNALRLRIIVEDSSGDTLVKDNPRSFNSCRREYSYRALTEKKAKNIKKDMGNIYSTEQDFMKELG